MENTSTAQPVFKLRPYTVIGLSRLYGVSRNTLKTWLKPFAQQIGQRAGNYFTVAQVQVIIDKLGLPSEIPLDD